MYFKPVDNQNDTRHLKARYLVVYVNFDVTVLILNKIHIYFQNETLQKWKGLYSLGKGYLMFHLLKVSVLLFNLLQKTSLVGHCKGHTLLSSQKAQTQRHRANQVL